MHTQLTHGIHTYRQTNLTVAIYTAAASAKAAAAAAKKIVDKGASRVTRALRKLEAKQKEEEAAQARIDAMMASIAVVKWVLVKFNSYNIKKGLQKNLIVCNRKINTTR